jgi:hypothetical protein
VVDDLDVVPAGDAAHRIVQGSPFRAKTERLDESALGRAATGRNERTDVRTHRDRHPTIRDAYLRQYSAMTPEPSEFDAPHWSNVEASSEEVGVATARFVKTGVTPGEYDQMREKLGVGDTPPAGGVFHAAAVGEDGKIRVFEV